MVRTELSLLRLSILCWGILLIGGGCRPEPEITSYRVPKQEQPEPPPSIAGRMLGGIILQDSQAWFFKMNGPDKQVEDQMEEFLAFCKSIKFQNAKPTWTLPDGWSEEPGNQFRFATLKVDESAPPLETSVTVLPFEAGTDENDYLLANINRWRDQLQMPPTTSEKLFDSDTKGAEVIADKTNAGDKLVLVNLVGRLSSSGGMSPPFASRGGPFSGPMSGAAGTDATTTGDDSDTGDIQYDLPKSWEKAELKTFQVAAFRARRGDQRVEISITPIGGDGGGLLANVNRWRGQIQLSPIDDAELSSSIKQLAVGDLTAKYVEIEGSEDQNPRQAIWGAVIAHAGQTWFVKLQGDHELAREEQPRFEEFVKSIRFE